MQSRSKIFNPYFHIPVLLWVVAGAVLLLSYSQQQLFLAVNSHYSDFCNPLMYGITHLGQPEVIIPTLLLVMVIKKYRNWWYIITAITCNILPLLIQQVLKIIFSHPRPLRLYGHPRWIHFVKEDWPELTGNNSFPSGHSQGAFSFFCFLTLLLPARYRPLGAVLFLLALSVCYSRMYLAAHFFEDVYTGSIIGAATTTIMFAVMSRYKARLGASEGL